MGSSLVNILDTVNEVGTSRKNSSNKPRSVFLRKPQSRVIDGTLRMDSVETEYDATVLESVVLAMIADYTSHSMDKTHRTDLLKNTTFNSTMLLDGIKRTLPDYRFLKCMPITDEKVVFQFRDPLNLEAIRILAKTLDHNIISTESEDKKGRTQIKMQLDGVHVLNVGNYNVSLPYNTLVEQGELDKGLQAATELVTRIHQDILLKGMRKVHLSDYQPIFKLMFPESFEDHFTEAFKLIREAEQAGKIQTSPEFHETRSSKYGGRDKRYALSKGSLGDHLEYVVVCPDQHELYVRLGSNFDFEKIQKKLKELGLSISDEKKRKIINSKIIKKGGGSRKKQWGSYIRNRDVVDEAGNTLFTLEGNNILKLHLNQDDETFEKASKAFSEIYYGRLFYTGSRPTSELKSDLTKEERLVINSLNSVSQLYNLFLRTEEDKKRWAKSGSYISSLGWIAEKMEESPLTSFEQRILYVLDKMDRRVSPDTFYKYGSEESTQKRLIEAYSTLQKLKGRFEAVCSVRDSSQ